MSKRNIENKKSDIYLVSAIITTHNREPKIVARAVKSVLKQTYKNIELIVVDDSSSTYPLRAEVELSIHAISDKIVYIKHEVSRGACAARNTGLSYSHGYYVGFLDDDDEWMPLKIEEQLKGFYNDQIAMVYSQLFFVDDISGVKYFGKKHANQAERGRIFKQLLKGNIVGPTSNPLLKKECIERVGGFDVLMESSQDFDLWLRIAMKYSVEYIDKPLLIYHIHPIYRITTDADRKINGMNRINNKYSEYINKDREVWYMQHIQLIPFYLKKYGRKKALIMWAECVRRKPFSLNNIKKFGHIVLGDDLYRVIRTFLASVYHRIKSC